MSAGQRGERAVDNMPRRGVWKTRPLCLAEAKPPRQRHAGDVFIDERCEPWLLQEGPYLYDAWMMQSCADGRFAHKGIGGLGVVALHSGDGFYGDELAAAAARKKHLAGGPHAQTLEHVERLQRRRRRTAGKHPPPTCLPSLGYPRPARNAQRGSHVLS